MTDWRVEHGDCLDVMRGMADDSVDAIVTDPPYGLGFMGKEWDHGVPGIPFWVEALRVAKPGAHLVAFGGTRTFHRLTVAIEDAGWEIRDCLSWLYGSGFPKSHNGPWGGTALKPAWEPIILARKPLIGTVAANVTAHGTGGLSVDECRIAIDPEADASQLRTMNRSQREGGDGWGMSTVNGDTPQVVRPEGRWPANVVLDEDAAAMLDEQAGERGGSGKASGPTLRNGNDSVARGRFNGLAADKEPAFYGDTGGASRFFYCAKASRSEREAGLEGMPQRERRALGDFEGTAEHPPKKDVQAANHHPTVKPITLMRWLCRLVTPAGGTVLDPFCGSGTTGCAAVTEGFRFIGVEQNTEYVELARKRIAHWDSQQKELV